MFASTKRKVLDGLNKRYIYGRVVGYLLLRPLPLFSRTRADPVARR